MLTVMKMRLHLRNTLPAMAWTGILWLHRSWLQRALGNLYSAEYLNPPLSPMLVIDRDGNVHQLEYGLKDAETLQKIVEPYLTK